MQTPVSAPSPVLQAAAPMGVAPTQAGAPALAPVQAPAMPAQPGAALPQNDKMASLANSVASAILAAVRPLFESLHAEIRAVGTNIALMQAGTAVATATGGRAASRRGAARPAAAAADGDKFATNSRLFFRNEYISNPQIEAEWGVHRPGMKVNATDFASMLMHDSKIASKEEGSRERKSATAFAVWGFLGDADRKLWKTRYDDAKRARTASAAPSPLSVEPGVAGGVAPQPLPQSMPQASASTIADLLSTASAGDASISNAVF